MVLDVDQVPVDVLCSLAGSDVVNELWLTHLITVLQALLIQLGAKECLIVDQDKAIDYDLGKIKALMERCGIVITERKKGKALPSLRVQPSQ